MDISDDAVTKMNASSTSISRNKHKISRKKSLSQSRSQLSQSATESPKQLVKMAMEHFSYSSSFPYYYRPSNKNSSEKDPGIGSAKTDSPKNSRKQIARRQLSLLSSSESPKQLVKQAIRHYSYSPSFPYYYRPSTENSAEKDPGMASTKTDSLKNSDSFLAPAAIGRRRIQWHKKLQNPFDANSFAAAVDAGLANSTSSTSESSSPTPKNVSNTSPPLPRNTTRKNSSTLKKGANASILSNKDVKITPDPLTTDSVFLKSRSGTRDMPSQTPVEKNLRFVSLSESKRPSPLQTTQKTSSQITTSNSTVAPSKHSQLNDTSVPNASHKRSLLPTASRELSQLTLMDLSKWALHQPVAYSTPAQRKEKKISSGDQSSVPVVTDGVALISWVDDKRSRDHTALTTPKSQKASLITPSLKSNKSFLTYAKDPLLTDFASPSNKADIKLEHLKQRSRTSDIRSSREGKHTTPSSVSIVKRPSKQPATGSGSPLKDTKYVDLFEYEDLEEDVVPPPKKKKRNSAPKHKGVKSVGGRALKERVPGLLPITYAKNNFEHFLKKRISRETVLEVQKQTDNFFNVVTDQLNSLMTKKKKCLEPDDVLQFFQKCEIFDEPFEFIVRELYPIEYQEKLVPAAQAFNKVNF